MQEEILNSILRELESQKCSGPHCPHETANDHYIIDKEFIIESLSKYQKKVLEVLEGMKLKEISDDAYEHNVDLEHNDVLEEAKQKISKL